ncbi:MAG: multidrug efflux RND transporter permease subunit, partial [Desulfovibrio sp.]|nr:multidrug efflux RND transporter permease subunit [Desulfovibrio sp.]
TTLNVVISHPKHSLIIYTFFCSFLIMIAFYLPSGFLPMEDQARTFATVTLPANSSLERTSDMLSNMEKYFMENEDDVVENILTVVGRGFSVNGQNTGALFIKLKDWAQRDTPDHQISSILKRAREHFHGMPQASINVFAPPAVPELGNAQGFDFILQDRGNIGYEHLVSAKNDFMANMKTNPHLANIRIAGLEDVDQYKIEIDKEKALAYGVSTNAIHTALDAFWGSAYINDFTHLGRTKKVYLQADAPFRMSPENFSHYYVRNDNGNMVPFSAFITGSYQKGPVRLERYNGVPAIEILGEAASGFSSGAAMNAIEDISTNLPDGVDWAWAGISLQEKMATGQNTWIYFIVMIIVYLCLAALYSSWTLPFPILLIIPAGASGSFIAAWMCHLNNDIYFQIGVLTITALASRNALIIVEFAKELVNSGKNQIEAIKQASCERIRPILITSLTFIAGIMPMIFSHGAGAGAQKALGIVIVGGMLSTSILVPYFTPLFYILLKNIHREFKP